MPVNIEQKNQCHFSFCFFYQSRNVLSSYTIFYAYAPFVDADETQKIWSKLREAYGQAMRRRKSKSGDGAVSGDPWRLERQMKWLDDFSHLRKYVLILILLSIWINQLKLII